MLCFWIAGDYPKAHNGFSLISIYYCYHKKKELLESFLSQIII